MNRRKELLLQYKNSKSNMGVYVFECLKSKKNYVGYAKDTKGVINGLEFRLGAGNYRQKALQRDWNAYGRESFSIRILENLPYDKDESKTDYTEELEILREIWLEKLPNSEVIL